MSRPYYKGLTYTERVRGANSEAENTTPTAYDDLINSSSPYYKGLTDQALLTIPNRESRSYYTSPYYKGLLNEELLTIPNRESQSTTISSSSSKTSFSDKIQNLSADSFKSRHPLSPHFQPSSLPSPAKRAVINAKETREPMEEKKYFWADKYRPANLENFINKKDKAIELKQKARDKRKTFKMKVRHFSF